MKHFKEFLKFHHYKTEEIDKIVSYYEAEEDKRPEGVDPAEIVKTHLDTQKELIINGAKSEIEKAAKANQNKETYLATIKPLINEAARVLGKSKDEIKALIVGDNAKHKPKDLFKMVADKVAEDSKPNPGEKDEKYNELKTKFEELQTKYFDEKDEWETQQGEFQDKIKAEQENTETFKRNFHRDRLLSELLNDEEKIQWAYPDQKRNNIELVRMDLLNDYQLVPDESGKRLLIKSKDGGIATSPDGNQKYDYADEAAIEIIKNRKMWKNSNGGGGNDKDKKVLTKGGKEVYMGGRSALAKAIGAN